MLKTNKKANEIEDITQDVSDISFSAGVYEVNLVGSNLKEWWIDTGATQLICSDKRMFTSFKPVKDEDTLYMENSATSEIQGECQVILKMTSGKELTLNNVLYVLKNLVSKSLLNKHGFHIVFKSDKVILPKNGLYVGDGHVIEGPFKLNVMNVKPIMNEMKNASTYLIESFNV